MIQQKVKRKKKPKILSLANGVYKLKEKFYLVLHKRNIWIETSNSFNSFDILQDPFIFLIILYCELSVYKFFIYIRIIMSKLTITSV